MKLNPEKTLGFSRGNHCTEFVRWPDRFNFHEIEVLPIYHYILLRKHKERKNNEYVNFSELNMIVNIVNYSL